MALPLIGARKRKSDLLSSLALGRIHPREKSIEERVIVARSRSNLTLG
jgi:hypothetical protein